MRHLTRMSKKPTTISGPVLRDFGPLPAYGVGFSWALAKKLKLSPQVQVARYDDPFTLPWNRRNEILIQIEP